MVALEGKVGPKQPEPPWIPADAGCGSGGEDEDGAGVCGGVDPVEVEGRLGDGLDGGQDDWELLGSAAGHDGVDRDGLDGGFALSRGEDAEHFEWVST